ncbi:serine/threonine-protein phosphatase 2A 56 kDa regulatory subunit alpha isoform [Drosophila mauritiana]|uniref:Serine/threonine-protein phosphatase 2A 56 kDa regulatory subunit alpha isoform n=1 Tax=Drosophila mauritiana TaxID=7226 RepID=A0A6P8L5K9_DROMA|nr:serine/threonine-protein phosphatase 2A 56 kDa regulatory subunit alpha isoform [Drosophila mauritiana]
MNNFDHSRLTDSDVSPCKIRKLSKSLSKKQAVTDLFSSFVKTHHFRPNIDAQRVHKIIVVKLVERLESKDARDRKFMQGILRRIYLKCIDLRPFIRSQYNDVFFRFIFEENDFLCIAGILDTYYDIIMGFTQPVETEHEQLLFKILLPLHKPPSLPKYFNQLIKCVIALLIQNPSFIEKYVKGLLRIWPKTSITKVTLFLTEIGRILLIKDEQEVKKVLPMVFNHMSKCLCNESTKVSEYTLLLWQNYRILEVIDRNHELIIPIVYPHLLRILIRHLGTSMQSLVSIVLGYLLKMNNALFRSLTSMCMCGKEPMNAKSSILLEHII